MSAIRQSLVLLLWGLGIFAEDAPGAAQSDLVERSVLKKELRIQNDTGPVVDHTAMNNPEAGVWSRKIGGNMLTLKPEMFQTFYIFLGISFMLMALILFRMYRLRSHRAERRYGVQGDKSAQELAHLPSAMIEEDESELEDDETVFDINKMRVYVA